MSAARVRATLTSTEGIATRVTFERLEDGDVLVRTARGNVGIYRRARYADGILSRAWVRAFAADGGMTVAFGVTS